MKYYVCFILLFLELACSAPAEDLISHLPGLSNIPSFKQYSGYLTASAEKHFHYWFVESQHDPANDPLLLWIYGGPGCSSVFSLLSENGPFHVNDDGKTLYNNPFSWNKIANVLYLESPAGVGYSYDDNGDVATNDDEVALNNYNALIDFFKKFPEFVVNQFFIFGESYSGFYVPTLTTRILQGSFKINFRGIGIGNGLSDSSLNVNSAILFAYYHGLFGETTRKSLSKQCCNGGWSRDDCDFTIEDEDCQNYVTQAMMSIYSYGINLYSLYRDCYQDDEGSIAQSYRTDMQMLYRYLTPDNRRLLQDMKLTTSRGLGSSLPCINSTASIAWMNRGDVRESLHIKSSLKEWSVCSDNVSSAYSTLYENMTAQYQEIFRDSSLRVLLYNGDVDIICNFLGDEWFVDDLKQPITKPRAPWYVKGQVAGFVKFFDRMTFTTIRGAGHMVPQWAPEYAYVMFENFIQDKPFNTK